MRPTCILALALAWGCTPRIPDQGVFVGNPGSSMVRVASGKGLDFNEVALADGLLVPTDCDGLDGDSLPYVDIDQDTPMALPSGVWCGLGLVLGGDTHFQADGSQGGTLEMDLEVSSIDLSAVDAVDLSASAWVLELADQGWVSAAELGVEDGVDVVVDPHEPAGEAATVEVERGSALFADPDRDGEISAAERLAGPAMVGTAGR